MECSGRPAPHLITGLRRLVDDLQRPEVSPGTGLTDVVCGSTELLSFQDDGVHYAGVPVSQLVRMHLFEAIVWMLLNHSLPTEEELADCSSIMAECECVDQAATSIVAGLPLGHRPLDLFPMALTILSFFDPAPQDTGEESARCRVWRLLAQVPVLIAADAGFEASHAAHVEIEDTPSSEAGVRGADLSFAGKLLSRLRPGRLPSAEEERAMNQLMICQCLTEMRPACFAARFSASTTIHISAALQSAANVFTAQLKNDPFCWTAELLQGFRDPGQAEAWWVRREGQPMPFGFAAAGSDDRAELVLEACQTVLGCIDRIRIAAVAARLEKLQLREHRVPTLDWASAKLMTLLEIPADRQAIVIALSRFAGWAAQAFEQRTSGVSLLPALRYGAD
jgi:citrate synthase